MSYVEEAYERITGQAPPKPWAERTDAEKIAARQHFIDLVRHSSDEDDIAVDELFQEIQKHRRTLEPEDSDLREESA